MKIKVSEATPLQLDWLVATIEAETELTGVRIIQPRHSQFPQRIIKLWDGSNPNSGGVHAEYTTKWAQGGPIIEREGIAISPAPGIRPVGTSWLADYPCNAESQKFRAHGPTSLIAAMRCYVASKLGDELNIPEELT